MSGARLPGFVQWYCQRCDLHMIRDHDKPPTRCTRCNSTRVAIVRQNSWPEPEPEDDPAVRARYPKSAADLLPWESSDPGEYDERAGRVLSSLSLHDFGVIHAFLRDRGCHGAARVLNDARKDWQRRAYAGGPEEATGKTTGGSTSKTG